MQETYNLNKVCKGHKSKKSKNVLNTFGKLDVGIGLEYIKF